MQNKCFLTNALSLNMIVGDCQIRVRNITHDEAKELLKTLPFRSAIGVSALAAVVSGLLGMTILVNRETLRLVPGDNLIVVSYSGARVPDGGIALPKGARVTFRHVIIEEA